MASHISIRLFATLLPIIVFGSGCHNLDGNMPAKLTLHKLELHKRMFLALEGRGTNCSAFNMLDDFLDAAKNAGLVTDGDYDTGWYRKDGWLNEMRWSKDVEDDKVVIRIISYGLNAVDEDGKGDDYCLEIVFTSKTLSSVKISFPERR